MPFECAWQASTVRHLPICDQCLLILPTDLDTSLFDKQFRWVYVKSQLVHGKIPISDTCATPVVSVRRRLRWQKVAVFDIQTREIPRDAALNVVVIGRKIKKKSKKGKNDHTDVVMAHGSFHLFDHNAVLAAGRQFLTLYAGNCPSTPQDVHTLYQVPTKITLVKLVGRWLQILNQLANL